MSEHDELPEGCEPEQEPTRRLCIPRHVYVQNEEAPGGATFPAVFDEDTGVQIKPGEDDRWQFVVASVGGKTKVLIRYDNVEVR